MQLRVLSPAGVVIVAVACSLFIGPWSTAHLTPGQREDTCLRAAILANQPGLVTAALAGGADPDLVSVCPESYGRRHSPWEQFVNQMHGAVSPSPAAVTPLSLAIFGNGRVPSEAHASTELVRSLLDHGADPNAGSALCSAVATGNLPAAKLLIARGARVNGVPGRVGPLTLAVECVRPAMVHLLLSNGADANACDAMGITPLMTAAMCVWPATSAAAPRRNLLILRLLVHAHADRSRKNYRGKSALSLARQQLSRHAAASPGLRLAVALLEQRIPASGGP